MIFKDNRVKFVLTKVIILMSVIIMLLSTHSVLAVSKAHQRPQMVYRIRVANDIDFMNSQFSGIKVKNIRLPDYEDINIDDNPWSYLVVYIGIDNIWFYQGQEMLHSVEAGLSIRGTEVNNPEIRGWHPFINYYPKKQYPPFNDPEAWRGEKIDAEGPIDLELRVSEVEVINQSYRWNVHFYVNGEEIAVRPIYANPGESNQFDVKICVGTYMASGDENEVSFAPFKIGDIQISESITFDKEWKTLKLADFGIPNHRIAYGEEVNNTEGREFTTDFEGWDYSYSIALKDDQAADMNKKSLLLFLLTVGLGFAIAD
ncbi:MAG: hypothetical protein PWR10_693 [Halanaerobiales bacterium]|nr:hypothetical protein [Halanaerobiales bacterium]